MVWSALVWSVPSKNLTSFRISGQISISICLKPPHIDHLFGGANVYMQRLQPPIRRDCIYCTLAIIKSDLIQNQLNIVDTFSSVSGFLEWEALKYVHVIFKLILQLINVNFPLFLNIVFWYIYALTEFIQPAKWYKRYMVATYW